MTLFVCIINLGHQLVLSQTNTLSRTRIKSVAKDKWSTKLTKFGSLTFIMIYNAPRENETFNIGLKISIAIVVPFFWVMFSDVHFYIPSQWRGSQFFYSCGPPQYVRRLYIMMYKWFYPFFPLVSYPSLVSSFCLKIINSDNVANVIVNF